MWTTDDFAYEGAGFRAGGQTVNPKPATVPPIWIGGNSARARQRVATSADGWAPFPAPAALAKTSKTALLETADQLAALLYDLWWRVEAAGRDRRQIDVSFSCLAGGAPASMDFDPDAHLAGLDDLARPRCHLDQRRCAGRQRRADARAPWSATARRSSAGALASVIGPPSITGRRFVSVG